MRRNIILLALIGLTIGCQVRSTDNTVQTPAKADLSRLGIVVIDVQGMTCEGCEETIAKSISSLGGISSCEVSHMDGIARVGFDTTLTTVQHIADAIEKSGYRVTGVSSVNEGANTDN